MRLRRCTRHGRAVELAINCRARLQEKVFFKHDWAAGLKAEQLHLKKVKRSLRVHSSRGL